MDSPFNLNNLGTGGTSRRTAHIKTAMPGVRNELGWLDAPTLDINGSEFDYDRHTLFGTRDNGKKVSAAGKNAIDGVEKSPPSLDWNVLAAYQESSMRALVEYVRRRCIVELVACMLYGFFRSLIFKLTLSIAILGMAQIGAFAIICFSFNLTPAMSIEFFIAEVIISVPGKNLLSGRTLWVCALVLVSQYAGLAFGYWLGDSLANDIRGHLASAAVLSPLDTLHKDLSSGILEGLFGQALQFLTIVAFCEFLVVIDACYRQQQEQQQASARWSTKGSAGTVAYDLQERDSPYGSTAFRVGHVMRGAVQALAVWSMMPYIRYLMFTELLASISVTHSVSGGAEFVFIVFLSKVLAMLCAYAVHKLTSRTDMKNQTSVKKP